MNPTAYKEIVSEHKTYAYVTPYGRVSCRKTNGQYKVVVEDFEMANTNRMTFKTLRGALIALEGAKGLI
jgi:hypothetical protein